MRLFLIQAEVKVLIGKLPGSTVIGVYVQRGSTTHSCRESMGP
jgi:hypothetical protein